MYREFVNAFEIVLILFDNISVRFKKKKLDNNNIIIQLII